MHLGMIVNASHARSLHFFRNGLDPLLHWLLRQSPFLSCHGLFCVNLCEWQIALDESLSELKSHLVDCICLTLNLFFYLVENLVLELRQGTCNHVSVVSFLLIIYDVDDLIFLRFFYIAGIEHIALICVERILLRQILECKLEFILVLLDLITEYLFFVKHLNFLLCISKVAWHCFFCILNELSINLII